MEAKIGGEARRFYGSGAQDFMLREKDMNGERKRNLDWDLNNWKWDGDLFIASPLNSVQADCRSRQLFPVREEIPVIGVLSNSSSSCSDEINLGSEKGKRELEKRRRVVDCEEDEMNDQPGNLTLKLGGQVYPIAENEVANCDEKNGKKTKLAGATSNRAVCQVEDCGSDLSNAKDYHRRHKVCEMHSKATKALVGNFTQRFCQQCSRFHILQEFDEGKRSCRRRLAGHNRRRRKTHPEATVNGGSLNDDRSSSYLLISLLRILSNMHSNNSDQAKDQDLLSHLLKNLASYEGTTNGQSMSGVIQESKDLAGVGATAGVSSEARLLSNGHETSRHLGSTSQINRVVDAQGPQMRTQHRNFASEVPEKGVTGENSSNGALHALTFLTKDGPPAKTPASDSTVGRTKLNDFDLNNIYSDSQDFEEGSERSQLPAPLGTGSQDLPFWLRKDSLQSSPPQTSGNSDSLSGQSPSSSSGDAQSRTDRIVFKLFGKDPNDFPVGLRAQILNWLSHSPTDIESYIRPGCIILTIYLRLAESTWQELHNDLSSSLNRLLDVSDDAFWRTGWVYTRVQHRIAFIYNGQVVLDTPLPLNNYSHSQISSVSPIAVSVSERVQFLVKGFNLSRPTTRLLCALEGKFLLQEPTNDLLDTDTFKEHNELQCLTSPCSVPDVTGRGFIEVEDALSSGFFPFIVAEQDVCMEIRMLETAIEVSEFSDDSQGATGKLEAKNQALDFIHEMGWLLHRSHLRSRLSHVNPNSVGFPFRRFRWLMEFSMDHDWCAVVKKLLDILFDGNVGSTEHSSVEIALLEMGLLHRAVRRSCRQMVELLLRYVPEKASATAGSEPKQQVKRGSDRFMFRPDAVGPAGLTPLHIAASRDGSETLLDALTDDPGSVGVEAWKTVRDSTGSTPEDYAGLRGHYSYIHLVHKKSNKKSEMGQVIVDIPAVLSDFNSHKKQTDTLNSVKVTGFQIDKTKMRPSKMQQSCRICDQQQAYGNTRRSLVYRPALLSLLAIAAVCVCVGLLFKSSPEVLLYPFRWELLDYGAM